MTKRQIRKAVKESISEGVSKQKAYEKLKAENKISVDDLAKTIQSIASLKTRRKHKVMNGNLMLIIIFTIILRIIAGIGSYLENGSLIFPAILLSINVLFLIGVATYKKGPILQ